MFDFLMKTSLNRCLYRLNQAIAQNMQLSGDLEVQFLRVCQYHTQQKTTGAAVKEKEHRDIINGIVDTVTIITNCLAKAPETLHNAEQGIIERAKGHMSIPDPPQGLSENEKPEEYAAFTVLREKRYDALMNLINTQSNEFKRSFLLPRVASFEELIQNSIPRLCTPEDPAAKAFAVFCLGVFADITHTLERFGITSFAPAAHEMWNSREHEIIFAQKDDGYKRGEVIKCVQSGYKQGETVILRSNIVAAR